MTSIVKKLKTLLNQPFPDSTNFIDTLKVSIGIGLFIFFFLLIFQPFGLSTSGSKIWKYVTIFGMISFGVTFLFDLIVIYVLKIDRNSPKWTFGKWLLEVLILIFCIGSANYLFIYFQFGNSHTWLNFAGSIASALLIGLFPVFLGGMSLIYRQERKNSKIAEGITLHPHPSDNNAVIQGISSNEIIFIESMQNYVRIWHLQNGNLNNTVVRNTLKNIAHSLVGTDIIKCHRSFLVNRNYVEAVQGNAQGLKLYLNHFEDGFVPVSRNYIHLFKD